MSKISFGKNTLPKRILLEHDYLTDIYNIKNNFLKEDEEYEFRN